MAEFILSRRENKLGNENNMLSSAFPNWQGKDENWLFISPHDDDVIIGSGILLQKAAQENVKTSVIIATDGQMGYCRESQIPDIVEIRKKETNNAFQKLNIDCIEWLNFPDGNMTAYIGRRKAGENDYGEIKGHTGLQNAFAYYLRKIKPNRIFIPTGEDLHPDHKIVFQELLISLFHSTSQIWPELGPPMAAFPNVYEMAVYCNFTDLPDIKIQSSDKILSNKLEAIKSFVSQEKIITKIVDKLKEGGPVEYFRDIHFDLYSAAMYQDIF